MNFDVDLFVIGAGSGGVRAARIAAGHGARVAVAEADRVGGTCVIRGCVPKKLLVLAGRHADLLADAASFGWSMSDVSFDWSTLISKTRAEVARLEGLYRRNLESSGALLLSERASLVDAHTVRLHASGRTFRARHIVVATGARPVLPELPGASGLMTSDDVFTWDRLPASVCLLGGGYIAVELAGLLHSMGVRTTLVHRGPGLLRGFDEDLQRELMQAYAARGIELQMNAAVEAIEQRDGTTCVQISDGRRVVCDAAVAAVGRRPNSAGLGLQDIGVKLDSAGAIAVDSDSRTSVDHVFAVGDVTDRVNLTPVAVREGHAVADLLFGGRRTTIDHSRVATAVFSTPELASVGPGEGDARLAFPQLKVFRSSFRPLADAFSSKPQRMLMKLLVDGLTDRVVAAHLVGPEAAELIQLLAVAVRAGVTKAEFDSTVAVHPTMAEELVTMRSPSPAN